VLAEKSAKAWPARRSTMRHPAKRFKMEVRALHKTGVSPTSCGRDPRGFTGRSLNWSRPLIN
jgi:hypothetical protein